MVMKLAINLLTRAGILYFLFEVILNASDPRFAGKAIPIRNFLIVITLSLLFPALYYLKRYWQKYPYWLDTIYLSIFALDMAGNSFNLYDRFFYFDLIPHFHGTGVIAAVLFMAFKLSPVSSVGTANIIHTLLEIQEYYTDVFANTHNIRGTFDVINDLLVGILGAIIYVLIAKFFTKSLK